MVLVVRGELPAVGIVIVTEVFLCMNESVFKVGHSGWHMETEKPVTQIEVTIYDCVSEWRLVPASGTHTARDNIYSDPHAL